MAMGILLSTYKQLQVLVNALLVLVNALVVLVSSLLVLASALVVIGNVENGPKYENDIDNMHVHKFQGHHSSRKSFFALSGI